MTHPRAEKERPGEKREEKAISWLKCLDEREKASCFSREEGEKVLPFQERAATHFSWI